MRASRLAQLARLCHIAAGMAEADAQHPTIAGQAVVTSPNPSATYGDHLLPPPLLLEKGERGERF